MKLECTSFRAILYFYRTNGSSMKSIYALLVVLLLTGCKEKESKNTPATSDYSSEVSYSWEKPYQTISLSGDTLSADEPSAELLQKLKQKQHLYASNPGDLDSLIWYGRFTAYTGDYRKAIDIYTHGLEQFPNESRLLRHRGHRYISLREFDKAIADLQRAANLIQGKENMVEEDGMPNAQNIPVSTMHGNIYYHLGLAHYLKGNYEEALTAYSQCLHSASNPDNVVSSTHWLYMILKKLGRDEDALEVLDAVSEQMNVIENHSYHKACLFYKGLLELEDVYSPGAEDTPSNSALAYAIGNWYAYNDQPEQAKGILNTIVAGSDWASFGYIAAETDLARTPPTP